MDPFLYYVRLGRVRKFVTENIAERITLETVADLAGLEKKYFCRFFKEKVGISFKPWLRKLRVSAAKRLLRSRNYQISEVAGRVGYDYLVTFERAFKAETGLTPSDYKKRLVTHRLMHETR